MDFDGISRAIRQVWDNKPGAVVLLFLGFCVFVFVVVDAWRHKRRHRRRERKHVEERTHK
ncbi:MAG TPA: hypothetical protein VN578_23420 [Candidatus Binatia bacterium]|jgi:hypothetical protein|nr:hypothetical protein [Candidatus Binatia bacterium]